MNEAQTREDLITPAIRAAGWTKENQCQILVEQAACEFAPGRVGRYVARHFVPITFSRIAGGV